MLGGRGWGGGGEEGYGDKEADRGVGRGGEGQRQKCTTERDRLRGRKLKRKPSWSEDGSLGLNC